jgi:hypothetical protein
MNLRLIQPTKRNISFAIDYSRLVLKKRGWLANRIVNVLLWLKKLEGIKAADAWNRFLGRTVIECVSDED